MSEDTQKLAALVITTNDGATVDGATNYDNMQMWLGQLECGVLVVASSDDEAILVLVPEEYQGAVRAILATVPELNVEGSTNFCLTAEMFDSLDKSDA